MAHRKHFIPFTAWIPDAQEYDPTTLKRVVNFLPVYGGHRPMAQLEELSTQASDPVTGTHAHRISKDLTYAAVQPYDDFTDPLPVAVALYPNSLLEIYQTYEGYYANDAKYSRHASNGANTVTEVKLLVEDPNELKTGATIIPFKVRYRLPSGFTGNYSIEWKIGYYSGGTLTVLHTHTVSGTAFETDGDDLWVTATISTTNLEYQDFVNFDIGVRTTVNIDAQAANDRVWYPPDSDIDIGDPAWTVFGSQSTLYESLDKTEPTPPPPWTEVDTDYIQSPVVGTDETTQFTLGVTTIADPDKLGLLRIHLRHAAATGIPIDVRLLEFRDSEEVEIWSDQVVSAAGGSPTDEAFNLLPDDYADVEDWSQLRIEVKITGQSGGGAGDQTYDPDDAKLGSNASTFGSGATEVARITDDDDATGFEASVSANSAMWGYFGSPGSEPSGSGTNYKARVRARAETGTTLSSTRFQVGFLDGETATPVLTQNKNVTGTGWAWYELDFYNKRNLITDWETLYIRVDYPDGGTDTLQVAEMEMILPEGGDQVKVYSLAAVDMHVGYIDTSWIQAQPELATQSAPGDQISLIVGAHDRVYEIVDPTDTWDDISNDGTTPLGSGPGSNTGPPVDFIEEKARSWDFCTWGDILIATNFVDPVQMKGIDDSLLHDLIGYDTSHAAITNYSTDGGETPLARFCATISSFLCLANVDPDSYVDGRPYTLWNSRIGDPTQFHPASYDWQSAIHQIIATPGEITGLVGGEYGILLKEDSTYIVEYVGLPTIFNFPKISIFQGCPYPRSVVAVGMDVYFWGAGGIFRISGGEQEEIGESRISKYLFDTLFESLSLDNAVAFDERINSSKVVGAYDPYSGCVVWSYQTSNDTEYQNGALIIYSPQTDRFTTVLGSDTTNGGFNIAGVQSIGNHLNDSDATLRSLYFIEYDANASPNPLAKLNRQGVNTVYDSEIETNVIPSSIFPGAGPGDEILIHALRPLYRQETVANRPEITIDITAGQSPIIEVSQETSQVVRSTDVREDGWIFLDEPLSGEFFAFDVTLQDESSPATKDFIGLQVQWGLEGEW